MAISKVGTFKWNYLASAGTTLTLAYTTLTLGDQVVLCATGDTNARSITGITGGGCTDWHQVILTTAGTGGAITMWAGTVSTVGAVTATVTFSASMSSGVISVEQLTAGLGAGTTWAVNTFNSKTGSGTSITYPVLTSTTANGFWYGYASNSQGGAVGSTPGFTYQIVGTSTSPDFWSEVIVYKAITATGSVSSPTSSQSPTGSYRSMAAIFTATGSTTQNAAATVSASYGMTAGLKQDMRDAAVIVGSFGMTSASATRVQAASASTSGQFGASASGTVVQVVANLAANTSFEWDSDGDGLADGWSTYGTPTCTLDTVTKNSGVSSQKVVGTVGQNQDIHFTPISITAGVPYTLSVYAKVTALNSSPAGQCVVKVEWHDASGALTNYDYTVLNTIDSGFVRRSVTSTPATGSVTARIILSAEQGATVYWDDLQFEQTAFASPYLEPDWDWASRAVFTPSDPTGTAGAIGFYIDKVSIRPYEASYAAIGLAAAYRQFGVQRFADAAWNWCSWYAAHMESDGTMYDYNIVGGTLTKLSTRDSTDSYAGMFLLALRAANIVRAQSLTGFATAIGQAISAIELTQDTDGLTWARPDFHAKYLEDQVETASGLFAAAELATILGDPTTAARARTDGIAMVNGIAALWNASTPTAPAYDWAVSDVGVHTVTTWGTYGDAFQQAMACVYGAPNTSRQSGLMTQFLTSQPSWADEVVTGRYDPIVAIALLRSGSTSAATAGLNKIAQVSQMKSRAFDWDPMKAGWSTIGRFGAWDLLYDLQAAPVNTGTVTGTYGLTATAFRTALSTGTVAASYSITAAGTDVQPGSATVTGTFGLTAAGTDTRPAAATVPGVYGMLVITTPTQFGAVSVAASYAITAGALLSQAAVGTTSGAWALSAALTLIRAAQATVASSFSITAGIALAQAGSGATSGSFGITASLSLVQPLSASLGGVYGLAGSAFGTVLPVGTSTGTFGLTANGTVIPFQQASMTASFVYAVSASIFQGVGAGATTAGLFSLLGSVVLSHPLTGTLAGQYGVIANASTFSNFGANATTSGQYGFTGSPKQTFVAQATMAASYSIAADSAPQKLASATVSYSYGLASDTVQARPLTAQVDTVYGVSASMWQNQLAQAELDFSYGISPVGTETQFIGGTVSGSYSLVGTGTRVVAPTAGTSGSYGMSVAGTRVVMPGAVVSAQLLIRAQAAASAGGVLNVSAWYIDKATGAYSPLPHFTKLNVAPDRNTPGAATIEYPAYGKNFNLLHNNLTNDNDCIIETWLGGSKQNAQRWILNQASGDDVDEAALWTFAGPSIDKRFDQALIYPQTVTTAHPTADISFSANNAGVIMATVLQQAQARGALTDITRDFTTTADSTGLNWPTVVNISFSPNTTLLQVLQKLVDLGMCDYSLSASGVLHLYAPGQQGIDRTTDPLRPVTFRQGVNLTEAPRKHDVSGSGTSVSVAGGEGVYRSADDATALARRGRRIEIAGSAGNITDVATVTAYAQQYLTQVTPGTTQITHGLTFTAGDPRPQISFDIGDFVWSDTQGVLEKLRVVQWVLSFDNNGPTGSITLNDKIDDRLERLKRQLALVSSGDAVVGTSVAPTGPDTLAPAAPTGVVTSSSAYSDGLGNTLATIACSWSQVTTNSDGTAADDVSSYRVEYAYASAPSTWNLGAVVNSATTTSISFGNVSSGVSVSVRVRALDSTGNASAWSTSSTLTTSNDTTAPPIPSAPSVSSGLSILKLAWDGLSSAGGPMGIDFDHVEIHMSTSASFTPTSATYLDLMYADGSYPVTQTPANGGLVYGTTYYFRLISVDRTTPTPNKSLPSGYGNGTPSQVVSADLFAGCVGTAALASLAVKTANIDNAAVNDLQVGNVSAGKITTGLLTATLTLSGIIRTASSGARFEADGAGIRLYNTSGTMTINFKTSDGSAFITGQIQTALSGTRLIMNPGNAAPDRIDFYGTTGTQFASIESVDVGGRGAVTITGDNSTGVNGGTLLIRPSFAQLLYGAKDASSITSEIYTDGVTARMNSAIVDVAIDTRTAAAGGNRFSMTMFDSSRNKIGLTQLNYWVTGLNEPWLAAVNRDSGLVFASSPGTGLNACVYVVGNAPSNHRDLRCYSVVYDGTVISSSSRKIKRNIRKVEDIDMRAATRAARAHRFEKKHQDEDEVLHPETGEVLRGPRKASTLLGLMAEDMPRALQARTVLNHADPTPVLGIDMGATTAMTWHGLGDAFDDIDELRAAVKTLAKQVADLQGELATR